MSCQCLYYSVLCVEIAIYCLKIRIASTGKVLYGFVILYVKLKVDDTDG